MNNIWLASLIAVPLIACPLIYFAGHLRIKANVVTSLPRTAALLSLIIEWVVWIAAMREFGSYGSLSVSVGTIILRMDGVGLLLTILILVLSTLVVLFSGPYMGHEHHQDKYYASLSAMIGAMVGLVCATDLFNLWLWFECMTVASYLLVAFYTDEPATLEASVKYLVQSAVGSGLILIGIALVLMQVGTLDLDMMQRISISSPALLSAGALFITGFGIKAAFVPMHTWLPDAHSQAPSGISAMLSGIVIEASLIAMLRVLNSLTAMSLSWGTLLMLFGALNMITGNLFALRQQTVKRLLAYSSLSHVGYMLLGLGIGLYSGQINGIQGGLFHLFNHGLMKGLAFLSAGALLYTLHLSKNEHVPLTIDELSGAAQRYPITSLALSISLLGLAGLPPLAGFMSKWQIFTAGFATHNVLIEILIGFAAFNSVLSLAYYIPLINTLYRQRISTTVQHGSPLSLSMRVPLIVLSLAIVTIGLWPGLLEWLTGSAAATFMQAVGR